MLPITRIRIKNFQNHKKLEIPLKQAITTIVGPSDTGKSGILRALRWVLLNKPNGDFFIRHGEKEALALVDVDGRVIRRARGKENTYQLDGVEYKAFGAKVPDEIQELLQLDDLNFQRQHDPLFWFGRSAPEVTKELNRVLKLDFMDNCMAIANRRVTRARTELDVVSRQLDVAYEEYEKCKPSIQHDKALKVLEKKHFKLDAGIDKQNAIKRLNTAAQTLTARKKILANSAQIAANLRDLPGKLASCHKTKETINESLLRAEASRVIFPLIKDTHALITHKNLRDKVANLLNLADKCEANSADLSIEIHGIKEKMTHCPTCGREYDV